MAKLSVMEQCNKSKMASSGLGQSRGGERSIWRPTLRWWVLCGPALSVRSKNAVACMISGTQSLREVLLGHFLTAFRGPLLDNVVFR
jgi:hypothetical protein